MPNFTIARLVCGRHQRIHQSALRASIRGCGTLLLSALTLLAVVPVSGQTSPSTSDKNSQSASAPAQASASSEDSKYRWSGDLQDLSRGYLQRLGENTALEDHAEQGGRALETRLRRLPRSGCGPCCGRRRQEQNIRVRGTLTARDQRALSDMPWREPRAVAFFAIGARQ